MADMDGATSPSHGDLNITPEEQKVYDQLFTEADPDGFGAVSGDVAVKFFEKTKLAGEVLGQIWQIADTENRGFLTPSGFYTVLRLIGHAQAGRTPTPQLATQPAPIPRFDNIPKQPLSAQNTGPPASPGQAAPPPIRVPALTPEKVNEYYSRFEMSGAENGSLPGPVAKQFFERARLPNEVLGRIWNLSDAHGRGALDTTEFVIAMHLLASYKSGAMRGVPNTLPPGLYEAASRKGRPSSFSRPGSGAPAISAIPPQFSGYGSIRPQSPISRQQVSTPLSSHSTGETWAITSADKMQFDQIFASLDKLGRGSITGEQAVQFFGNARLPEEILAQIWDLADINSEGQLNKDEFAVAMYLIRQQRGTRDGRGNLPSTLPPALIPPSMRKQKVAPSQPTAPAFENAIVTQPRSAADDLFGLDAFAAPSVASAQVPQSTGGTDSGTYATPRSPAPAVTSAAAASNIFKPFVPSSSFGQSILPQQTGFSATSQNRSLQQQIASDDLLGDADPEVSQRLTNETSELANLSNQVGNLAKQTTEIQSTRGQAERELSQSSQQKREFETRLGQLRSLYEQEVKDVKSLQSQLSTSRNETKRIQQDMAMIGGTHQDLNTQHQQLAAALQADQQENASLKEKIRQMNTEIEQLKPQLEKVKSDARQQKGLVAINKKQLSTNEAERDRIRSEIAASTKEAEDASREAEEIGKKVETSNKELEHARSVPAATATARSASNVVSPAASTHSNPFFRSAALSPPITENEAPVDGRSAFDNIFGPSFSSSSPGAAPSTSFQNESPAQSRDILGGSDSFGTDSPVPAAAPPDVRSSTRQITSSALPFRTPLDRADSISSSVKVAPPISRLSPADTPRALSPAASNSSHPSQSGALEDPFGSESVAPTSSAVEQVPEESNPHLASWTGNEERVADIPGAFPDVETPRSEQPQPSFGSPAIAAGVGATALAAGAGLVAASAHENSAEEGKETQSENKNSEDAENASTNFDDLFGGPAHQRSRSEQVADFDSAFASMDNRPATNGTSTNGNREFPDIQELDGDDSSDYSQETPVGFEDDFNAKSSPLPPQKVEGGGSGNTIQQGAISALPGYLQAPRPPFQSTASTASSLPGIDSQTSPPTYNDSVPGTDPAHFPPEFKGLLPSREDPTSPTPASQSSGAQPDSSYGPEVSRTEVTPGNVQSSIAPQSKESPFDFDSAFADMAPGNANDGDDDDEDESFTPGRHHAPDFDPTFDSSPTQSHSTITASNAVPNSVYNSVTNGSEHTPAPFAKPVANEFDTFGDSLSTQTAPGHSTVPAATGGDVEAATPHDWDTMFAGIDAPPAASAADITSTPASHQAADMSSPSALKQSPQKPPLARALSDGTEHDDPILKRLTAMGWSRDDSLKALEQFDYNIDKAADYLTFKS